MNKAMRPLCVLISVFILRPAAKGFQQPQQTSPLSCLQANIERITRSVNAKSGIYMKCVETGEEIALNADETMNTMSVIKIPLMVEVFRLSIQAELIDAAHQWYSSYLVAIGRFDEAIAEAKRAEELEPLSFISNSHLGWYLAGRNDEAIQHCRRLLDVDPNFFPARQYLGLCYEQKGMYKEAIGEFQPGAKLSGSPLMLSLLGHAHAASGNKTEALQILTELDRQKQRNVSPYTVATIYAGLCDRDTAFKWLEKAFEDRDVWLMNLKVDPIFSHVRSDRRFTALLDRIGIEY